MSWFYGYDKRSTINAHDKRIVYGCISAGACVISLDLNVNLWHQGFSSLENLAEQEKLWCQFFCDGFVCKNRLFIEP